MIDMHIHVVPPDLPGVGDMNLRPVGGFEAVAEWLRDEMGTAGVHSVLAMGSVNGGESDSLSARTIQPDAPCCSRRRGRAVW